MHQAFNHLIHHTFTILPMGVLRFVSVIQFWERKIIKFDVMEKLLIYQYQFFLPVTNIARCSRRAELRWASRSSCCFVIDDTSKQMTLQIWGFMPARAFFWLPGIEIFDMPFARFAVVKYSAASQTNFEYGKYFGLCALNVWNLKFKFLGFSVLIQ